MIKFSMILIVYGIKLQFVFETFRLNNTISKSVHLTAGHATMTGIFNSIYYNNHKASEFFKNIVNNNLTGRIRHVHCSASDAAPLPPWQWRRGSGRFFLAGNAKIHVSEQKLNLRK